MDTGDLNLSDMGTMGGGMGRKTFGTSFIPDGDAQAGNKTSLPERNDSELLPAIPEDSRSPFSSGNKNPNANQGKMQTGETQLAPLPNRENPGAQSKSEKTTLIIIGLSVLVL